MKEVKIENYCFEIIENIDNCFDIELFKSMCTDYFFAFDYIIGDYAYNKLRLKGFCEPHNKNYKQINDIKGKDNYLKERCAYKCKYFVLKKVKNT